MGLVKGLTDIQDVFDKDEAEFQERKAAAERPKAKWFGINDKESVLVAFLQEFNTDSDNFSQKNGQLALAIEHVHPDQDKWKIKAQCSMADEGVCYGEDQKWKRKLRLYVNVLVDNGVDEPYVAILSQSKSSNHITDALMEHARAFETITDKWFKIKRSGAKFNDTSYTLTALKEHGLDVEAYELYDLKNYVAPEIPYSEQEEFYTRLDDKPSGLEEFAKKKAEVSSESVNNEW